MRVLVLGGYGLIGSAIAQQLLADGHAVTALGRKIARARIQMPGVRWLAADISRLQSVADWTPLIKDSDVIVNAAGALQTGLRDDLGKLQAAFIALYDAAAADGTARIIVISAPGARLDASTDFSRSKARADAHLRQTALDWTILRPGLVIARQAYGGTAMLRALASLPYVMPIMTGTRPVKTVDVDDVAHAVTSIISGKVLSCRDYDLVEPESHALADIVARFRAWFGYRPAPVLSVPPIVAGPFIVAADLAGWLGWRSPLRSTAVAELAAGVTGCSRQWLEAGGNRLKSLEQSLAATPATVQERWFGRLWALKPVVIVTLAAFWLASGLIALGHPATAAAVLTTRGVASDHALILVICGALVDVALGLGILVRISARVAMIGMLLTSFAYLLAGTWLAPDLWTDPLGPLVKIGPSLALTLVGLAILEER
jgi:uncharacterized protein YbjT (DUF2867 family)